MVRLASLAVGAGVVALLASGPGCSLLLDFDAEITDAAPVPDGPLPDADPNAPDAAPEPSLIYEPNDTQATATPIEVNTAYGPIAVDPLGDKDFFVFTTAAMADVTIDCKFKTMQGDLDMRLYDMAMAKIGESASVDDDEQIVKAQLPPGTYAVEVYGFNDMRVNKNYTLTVTVP